MERIETGAPMISARDIGLVGCVRCTKVWPIETERCGRCGKRLSSRDQMSLQKVWAWWLMGVACYVPANLWPMLQTRTLFTVQENTIVGGAIDLIHHGDILVAAIILFASVVIPTGKFLALAFLALSVQRSWSISGRQRQMLFEVVEYIGRWSMIDVFVVAILSALVQLKVLVSINPGPASLFFACSVIFTMLSAQSFDSRIIWDSFANENRSNRHG